MILIVSNANDQSTTEVIDWCIYFKQKYFLITEDILVTELTVVVDESYAILTFNNSKVLDTREISSFWYRRQTLHFVLNFSENVKHAALSSHLENEWQALTDYIFSLFQKKACTGNYFISDVNKLMVLEIARELGIKTPRTIISSRLPFGTQTIREGFINKTIHNILMYSDKEALYMNRTIAENDLKIPESPFFPSLFQPEIKKKYEVRTFFLKDKFSSIAILSQGDPQTKTDFRMYNYKHPNRNVPYTLPDREKEQMIMLMQCLKLDCGSIDFLVDQSNELLFLEVNPVGQFGMVSKVNNDPIEMNLCQHLMNN